MLFLFYCSCLTFTFHCLPYIVLLLFTFYSSILSSPLFPILKSLVDFLYYTVPTSLSPLQSKYFNVSIPVSPFHCTHYSVPIQLSPSLRLHFIFPNSVSPTYCFHYSVPFTVPHFFGSILVSTILLPPFYVLYCSASFSLFPFFYCLPFFCPVIFYPSSRDFDVTMWQLTYFFFLCRYSLPWQPLEFTEDIFPSL